jgi:hypothetical protein
VLIGEPKDDRGEWPLGRVVETYPGADGFVRAVKVQSKSKEYIRPIHRLCPLEFIEEQSDSDDTCAC